jgi:hypothetical protein
MTDDKELPPGSRPPHPAQSTAARPEGWPTGVRPISMDGVGHLGVGNDGTLYWDGRPVRTAKKVTLSFWQAFGAILTVIAALMAGGGAAASAWADWHPPQMKCAPPAPLPAPRK